MRKQIPVRQSQRERVRSPVRVPADGDPRRVHGIGRERPLERPVEGLHVRSKPPAPEDHVPGRPARGQRQQHQPGFVGMLPQLRQPIARVLARTVQQHHERNRTLLLIPRRHVQVPPASTVPLHTPQADWGLTGKPPRSRPQTPSLVILFRHANAPSLCSTIPTSRAPPAAPAIPAGAATSRLAPIHTLPRPRSETHSPEHANPSVNRLVLQRESDRGPGRSSR